MPIRQGDVNSPDPPDGSEFEKNLAKYYALLEHSDAKDVKLFFYGELTRLLEGKLAEERKLRQTAEKEVVKLRAASDNKPDIDVTVHDKPCQSGGAVEASRQSESLKAEVQRAWSVAAMIEENLCKKEIELDRKEQKVRELKEKLTFAVQQSRAAACRLREDYQNLVNIPPIVEIPNVTVKVLPISTVSPSVVKDAPMPRLEHPTKRVKLEHSPQPPQRKKRELLAAVEGKTVEQSTSAKKRKVEPSNPIKKIKIKNCTKKERVVRHPPLVALQGLSNNEPSVRVHYFQAPKETRSSTSQQNPSKTYYNKRGPSLKKGGKPKNEKKDRGPYKPVFIFCVHCEKTRQLLPRKNGSGFTFRHTCPKEPTAKRVTQSTKYKVATCKLNHEGPCARLATPEEVKTCKRRYHGQGEKQVQAAKKKSVTIGA